MNKNIFYGFIVAIFPLALIACSNNDSDGPVVLAPDGEETIDTQKQASDEAIADFFNSEVAGDNTDYGLVGFFKNFDDDNKDICLVINSMVELQTAYEGEKQLPLIDFTNQTLLVGQQNLPTYAMMEGLEFSESEKSHILTLNAFYYVGENQGNIHAMEPLGFWTLCPKLSDKPIEMKYTLKEVEK